MLWPTKNQSTKETTGLQQREGRLRLDTRCYSLSDGRAYSLFYMDRTLYHQFKEKLRLIEGGTIIDVHHKNAAITLVKRHSKTNITVKPIGQKTNDSETTMNQRFQLIPRNLIKSITFDCGK